ncbi:MAG: phenylalanine--tRNA ligase subunit alpha [Flammeovirgaceae bacterium]|nr:phenylalanine--tRNA ligase subunit alpha [Flammeovirgaceae bacterium]
MEERIQSLLREIDDFKAKTKDELEAFRLKFTSRKGIINDLFEEFKQIPGEQKKNVGKILNQLKQSAESKLQQVSEWLESSSASETIDIDLTLPPIPDKVGNLHPLTLTKNRIIEIFERLGFNVEDGPEIEDDWHNFTALNFPLNHPAREMQDTFFIKKSAEGGGDILLRTHTSNVQIRMMQNGKPPFRAIMPGRVYRNEAISARAHCFFHQVEGLYVDRKVGFADLKQTLYHFAKEMFGKDTKIRFRPSFFPFTEPSAEIDISCLICGGSGCNVCKYSGWVEIAGSGMVHPNVLRNCGIDPEEFTGFAFGMGIERVTMLRYQINDLRLFSENDVRFLKQFQSVL